VVYVLLFDTDNQHDRQTNRYQIVTGCSAVHNGAAQCNIQHYYILPQVACFFHDQPLYV